MDSTIESKIDKPLIIDFVAGSAAGIGMCLSGHPLDTIKVHIQSASANAKVGIFSCTRDIIKTFGPMGLYRGVLSPLSSTPLINATVFAGESFCSRLIKNDLNPVISTFMSGFCAGAFQTVVLCPTDVVKLKMQLTNTNLNTISLTKHIIETSGIKSLFRGFGITLCRDAPAYGVYFSSFEYFTSKYLDFNVDPSCGYNLLVNFVSGGLAGILCWIVTYPLDIVKTRFQNITNYTSYATVTRELYRESGLKGFFRGMNSTIIRAFITNAVTFVIMTQCQYYLTQIYNQEKQNGIPNIEQILYTSLPGDYIQNKKCCCSSPRRCLQCFHMDLFHLPEAGTTFLEPMLHTHGRLLTMNQNYNIPFDMRLLMLSFQQNNQNFNPFSNIFPNVMPQLAQQVQSYEFLQNWLQACNNINYGNQNKDLPPLTTPSTINQSFPLPGQSSMENLPQAYQKFLTYDKIEINFPRTSTTPLMKKNEGVFHDARKQNYQTPDSGIDSPASNQNLPESPKNDTSDVSVSTSVLTDDPSTNEPTTPTKGCNGKKKNYCYVCEKFIVNRNGRNQGPRRHVLQIHLKKPLYLCRICNYSSTYDKYHVTSHIKRIHDIDNTDDYIINNKYEQEPEVCVWYKKCFEDKLEPQ